MFNFKCFLQVGTRIKARVGLGSRDITARAATGGAQRARPGGNMMDRGTTTRSGHIVIIHTGSNNLSQGSAEDYDNYTPPCVGQ